MKIGNVACQCNIIMEPKASWKSMIHSRNDKVLFKPENNKMHIKTNKILKFKKCKMISNQVKWKKKEKRKVKIIKT